MCSVGLEGKVVRHQDTVTDPVLGQLVWQGYGDGIWWRGELVVGAFTIEFLIDGEKHPYPRLVSRAHSIAVGFKPFHQALNQYLTEEALRRPPEAVIIEQLRLKSIALFQGHVEDDREGYSGEFAIFQARDEQSLKEPFVQEWRCDIQDGHFANLVSWS